MQPLKRRGTKKQLLLDALILKTLSTRVDIGNLAALARVIDTPYSTVKDHVDFLVAKRLLPSNRLAGIFYREQELTGIDFSPELKNILSK